MGARARVHAAPKERRDRERGFEQGGSAGMERYAGGRGSADGSAAAHDAVVRGHRDLGESRTMRAERSGEELVRRCQRNLAWNREQLLHLTLRARMCDVREV